MLVTTFIQRFRVVIEMFQAHQSDATTDDESLAQLVKAERGVPLVEAAVADQ